MGGEGDVLGTIAVVRGRGADAEGDPDASVVVGDRAAAVQPVGVGDVDALLGTQSEDGAVEQGGLVELVPGLGECQMVDPGHA